MELSLRERQVLAAIVQGRMQKQISMDLGIGERTAEYYYHMIRKKLGARTMAHAVAIAYERRILPAHDATEVNTLRWTARNGTTG